MSNRKTLEWKGDGTPAESGLATFHFTGESWSVPFENFTMAFELDQCIQRDREAVQALTVKTVFGCIEGAIKDLKDLSS